MGDPQPNALINRANQTRFTELFNLQSSNGGPAHAQTLIAAFKDPVISGGTPRERFVTILELTGGSGPPTLNINDTVRDIGNSASFPQRAGDTGFRRELRDSIRYLPDAQGADRRMWLRSSNQIGHFLTAAHFAYYFRENQSYFDQVQRSRAQRRAELNPVLSFIHDLLTVSTDADVMLSYAVQEKLYQQAMIGHELVQDGGALGSGFGPSSAVFGTLKADSNDISHFLEGRLDQIAIDDRKEGNSYQDILLTWIGYRFGTHVSKGVFSNLEDTASWLTLMLTPVDLSKVAPGERFYEDAQVLGKLIEQFKRTQRGR